MLVIGDNPEEQLAPFHEFECTGQNDQYVQDVDMTEEFMASMKEHGHDVEEALEYDGWEEKTITDMAELDIEGAHKYGYVLMDTEGNVVKVVRRTNPNSQDPG